jgi:alanine racemase
MELAASLPLGSIDSEKLHELCSAVWLQRGLSQRVNHLAYDTRRISNGTRSVFFALRTAGRDGAAFVDDAWRTGVRLFVVHPDFEVAAQWREGSFLAVSDTLLALQQVAAWHRSRLEERPILAITGSNGKTVVKDWLYELLSPDLNVHRSPRSYNSQLGVALSVWRIPADADLSIIEAGVSQTGEMARLHAVIRPTHGLFTHLGDAHDGGFSNRTQKLREKFLLFDGVKSLTVRVDDPMVAAEVDHWRAQNPDAELLHWRMTQGTSLDETVFPAGQQPQDLFCSVYAEGTDKTGSLWRLEWASGHKNHLHLPFSDGASVENALSCRIFLAGMGYPPDVWDTRFGALRRPQMRMEIREALQGSVLINDAYSLDIDSLGIALQYMKTLPHQSYKVAVLSDFDDSLIRHNPQIYAQALEFLREAHINLLLAVGAGWRKAVGSSARPECLFYRDTEHLLQAMPYERLTNCIILLKGARRYALERVDRRLSIKQHQTVFEIDLDAVLHNFRAFRALLKPETRVMVMVKALSYGSGTGEVAALVQHHKADYLAVAYPDEGVALRRNGIQLPIMVMNPDASSIPLLLEYQLEPEIYSFTLLGSILDRCLQGNGQSPLRIHLNLDTGMNRLGFSRADWPELCTRLSKLGSDLNRIRVQSIYTHLVASESAEHDAFTRQQIQHFTEGCACVTGVLGYMPLRHVLNTAGIIRFPEAQMDMVRLGIGLYGVDPIPQPAAASFFVAKDGSTSLAASEGIELRPAGSLLTTIAQIHETEAGDTIGYGRKGRPVARARVATIPIGYADGIPWQAGEGSVYFLVNGKPAPTLGRICMDLCMLDVTGIECREGDVVEVFGQHQAVSAIARALNTIPYALLSGISQRVKRVYLRDT